jgi:hypothetical protein
MTHRKMASHGLVFSLLLSVCAFSSAQSLRASPPIGAVVQSSDYDAVKGVTTVHIVNTSDKEISALNLSFHVDYPDGRVSGPAEFGLDFLEGVIQGIGGFAPGAAYNQEFPGQEGPVQATVDMVAYVDGTADVLNEGAFRRLVARRKANVLAMQKVDELLNGALADPAEQHPSARVVAELKSLVAAMEQQKINDEGTGSYGATLKGAIQDISNKPQSPAGRRESEDNSLRALIKTYGDRISITMRHTELVKAVQP